jgi:hypothetical protein
MTVPDIPDGTLRLVSLTSEAFSPKIALNNFSSGVNCVSPFGVTLPTKHLLLQLQHHIRLFLTHPNGQSFSRKGLKYPE